jgi:hypothetical protein
VEERALWWRCVLGFAHGSVVAAVGRVSPDLRKLGVESSAAEHLLMRPFADRGTSELRGDPSITSRLDHSAVRNVV